jgi:HK97 family phage portal protein
MLMSDSLFTRLARVIRPEYKSPIVTSASPVAIQTKSSLSLLSRGAYGAAYEFFSPDGGTTIIDITQLSSHALAFVAYWYCATRWRAQKIAEAPLMVVKENQDDGSEEWLPDHDLVSILDEPSEDYDMGELIERTSRYLDNTAACIWVIDSDKIGRAARLTPFSNNEFTVSASSNRLYQTFRVQTRMGPKEFDASEVCYFHEPSDAERWMTTNDRSRSRLDVAMSWLRLGERAQRTIRDLLSNAVWPSAVVIPDKEWNPDPETLEEYKQDLEAYSSPGRQGKPFVQLGGGDFKSLSASLKDLVPTDVLNRVESVVAAVSGVPAIVLQFEVGLINSPWSQMAQARQMAYDDCVQPAWKRLERVMTRQLLRPVDDDPTHFIRFDTAKIASLQANRRESAAFTALVSRIATVNERRTIVGLEPVEDPKADLIPEITAPILPPGMLAPTPPAASDSNASKDPKEPTTPTEDPKPPKKKEYTIWWRIPTNGSVPRASKALAYVVVQRKIKASLLIDSFRDDAKPLWEVHARHQLTNDKTVIVDIVRTMLTDAVHKSVDAKARGSSRVYNAVTDYLRTEGKTAWTKSMLPLFVQGSERSVAVAAADLSVNYNILHPSAINFAQRETGSMITQISKTTRQFVVDVVSGGLKEGRSTGEIAQLLEDGAGFSKERAALIARTETTTVFSGAPIEALSAFGSSTGRSFLKTWFGVMDDKERDEHVELEGETVGIDEPFSNGLMYPSEPNCRCMTLTHEETDE